MKTKFSLVIAAMLLFVSCSQEEPVNEANNQILDFKETIDSGNRADGFQCDPDYVFPVYDPRVDSGLDLIWHIYYDTSLTPEEVACVRQEYFTIHGLIVRMCILQPTNPHQDCWNLMPGYPSQTTSTTIDDDPRLTVNNSSGG